MRLLTFDLEDWYHANLRDWSFSEHDQKEDHRDLSRVLGEVLGFLSRTGQKGTFFILGRLVEKRPDFLERILAGGHEAALHGYEHHLLRERGRGGVREDLERSLKIFEKVAGNLPLGFRAPSWSIFHDTLWLYDLLETFGLAYDASVFPVKTALYGMPEAPNQPFFPVVGGKRYRILEIPTPTFRWAGRRIPFSGGLYFNLLPYALVRALGARMEAGLGHCLYYFHLWDLYPRPGRLPKSTLSWTLSLRLGDPLKRFRRLMEEGSFSPIRDALESLKTKALEWPLNGEGD